MASSGSLGFLTDMADSGLSGIVPANNLETVGLFSDDLASEVTIVHFHISY